mgnify:CR=1 FL=1
MMEAIILILTIINSIVLILLLIKSFKKNDSGDLADELRKNRMEITSGISASIGTLSESLKTTSEMQSKVIKTNLILSIFTLKILNLFYNSVSIC